MLAGRGLATDLIAMSYRLGKLTRPLSNDPRQFISTDQQEVVPNIARIARTMSLPDPPPPGVSDELFTIVHDELRELADRRPSHERPDHTLRPTELVHEVYFRLSKSPDLIITGRNHMMGLAGRVMPRILVEHARRRNAGKWGGAPLRVTLDEAAAEVVQNKYFAGLAVCHVPQNSPWTQPRPLC